MVTRKNTTVRRRKGAPKIENVENVKVPSIKGRPPAQVQRLVGLLFGPPKTGKTTAACSGKNVLLISFDPDGDYTETLQGRDDITVITPEITEMDGIIRALRTTDRDRFDYVVLDSVTFLFQQAGGEELYKTYKANKDVRRPYGKAGAIVAQIINDLVTLPPPVNVFFTAHLQHEQSEDELISMDAELGENEVKVGVTPMVWKILGPAVSFIGRTYKRDVWVDVEDAKKKKRKKEEHFFVSFNDGQRSPAGSRLPMAAEYQITLDWLDKLHTKLVEGGKK